MNANTAAKNNCQCRNFADATTGERLACTATTARNFAPGHDARLKGHLIRIGRAGHLVATPEGTEVGHMEAASRYGFARQVAAGATKPGRSTKVRKAAAAPKPTKITAKVGRWTYEGTTDGNTFSYTDKRGNAQATTKYTRA